MDEWLQGELVSMVRELFNGKNSACRQYFDLSYINTMIDDHATRRQNYQRHLFLLLSFELWHKSFLEGVVAESNVKESQHVN